LKALEKNELGYVSEAEVMQGMWKEKMAELRARQAAKGESNISEE